MEHLCSLEEEEGELVLEEGEEAVVGDLRLQLGKPEGELDFVFYQERLVGVDGFLEELKDYYFDQVLVVSAVKDCPL